MTTTTNPPPPHDVTDTDHHHHQMNAAATTTTTCPRHWTPTGWPVYESGSQTPQQLRILGRVLLWQAQETYHRHSIRAEQTWFQKQQQQQQQQPKSAAARTNHPSVVPPVQTKDIVTPPLLTLQTCVSLGAKMLLESRIRTSIRNIQDWLVQSFSEVVSERLTVEWLLLPIFDVSAQFVLSFGSWWYLDAHIWCDKLTVTRFGDQGDYRKVTFHSDQPFEIYVKTALRRIILSHHHQNNNNNIET